MRIRSSKEKQLINVQKGARKIDKANNKDFSGLLGDKENELHLNELHEILENIDQKGESLKETGNVVDLKAYKNEVRRFLKVASQKGLRTRQISTISPDGSMKLYTIIEKVDEALQDLTEAFLDSEKNNLDIIGKLEEIRGLLVDVFA